MATILPTGRCFDDALDLLTERIREGAAPDALRLVHAILRAENGRRYVHAWLEEHDQVWDAGTLDGRRIYYAVAWQEYYQARKVEERTRYTPHQALIENARTGHYGPWKPHYLALCATPGDGGRVLGAVQVQIPEAFRVELKRKARNRAKAARRRHARP